MLESLSTADTQSDYIQKSHVYQTVGLRIHKLNYVEEAWTQTSHKHLLHTHNHFERGSSSFQMNTARGCVHAAGSESWISTGQNPLQISYSTQAQHHYALAPTYTHAHTRVQDSKDTDKQTTAQCCIQPVHVNQPSVNRAD